MFYKITLKPIGDFYFGGESSFGKPKSDMSKQEAYFAKSAYFAQGEMFPQQTHVLGMLRKTILRKNGFMKLHKNGEWVNRNHDDAKNLVGKEWTKDLGKIIKISTVHLEKESTEEIYYPAPYDYSMSLHKQEGKSYINGREDLNSVYAFKVDDNDFGAKSSLCYGYISKNSKPIGLDKIFMKKTRIGNQTYMPTDDDKEQLYKISSYMFSEEYKDFHFVCYMETVENTVWTDEYYTQTVELGGERSIFKMNVSKVDDVPNTEETYIQNKKNETRIVLTSDAYVKSVNENIFDNVEISLAHKRRFRTVNSSKNESFSKSSKKILLTKGSVLYPKGDALETIVTVLKNEKEFRSIGYNQYVIIEKKEI